MMSRNTIIRGVVEAGIWYVAIYYFLYTLKHEVNLMLSAFILLALVYAAAFTCPFIHNTQAWQKMWND